MFGSLFICSVVCFTFFLAWPASISRDIAIQLAGLEGAKQRLTGGWWKMDDGRWVRASAHVRSHLAQHPIIQNHLGWSEKLSIRAGDYIHSSLIILMTDTPLQGTIQLIPTTRRRQVRWRETTAFKARNKPVKDANSIWTFCASISAVSEDICQEHAWVFARVDTVREVFLPSH